MEYEMINEYEEDGLRIKIKRPVLTEVERIERSKRIAKQLKNVAGEHRLRGDSE